MNQFIPPHASRVKSYQVDESFFTLRPMYLLFACLLIFLLSCTKTRDESSSLASAAAVAANKEISGKVGINVLLKTAITKDIVTELKLHGSVGKTFPELKALTMMITADKLAKIQGLAFVKFANPDAERNGGPVDAVPVPDFSAGISTWNLDAINVTETGQGRTNVPDGAGVYIGVLDTGLPDSWRQYFPQERIATQYAKSFGGGGNEQGNVSEQPNKWEHDQNSHGGHVTSTILGYKLGTAFVNGVAPMANIIPVKVLNQNGSGWSSTVSEGILYIASLKAGVLKNSPVVINMSLGGPELDAMETAAIDYAISTGVIIVASAGNSGEAGMGYPGGYAPVISVAAALWKSAFTTPTWWYALDVADPTNTNDFAIASFSSRQKTGQDLDVAAPGYAVLGPYQINSGQLSYYFLAGTSMASPHVAGIVALMAQVKPGITPAQAELKLEAAALPMAEGATAAGHGFITADAAISGL
ncbi:MAG: S8 family serine peptidase [Bacteroidota bacterium]